MRAFFRDNRADVLAAGGIALLALAVYVRAFGLSFAGNDSILLEYARSIYREGWIGSFFTAPPSAEVSGGGYSPLSLILVWGIEAAAGAQPALFHLASVLLHCAVAVSCYFLYENFLPKSFAFWAALLFAVHPANTETVYHIYNIGNLLSGLFVTLAAVFLLGEARGKIEKVRARVWGAFSLSLALLSGPWALLAPLALFAMDFAKGREGASGRRRAWALISGVLLIAYIALVSLGRNEPSASNASPGAFYALLKYLWLMAVPFPLSAHHQPAAFSAIALLMALPALLIFVFLSRAKHGYVGIAAFLWALLFLFPSLGLFGGGTVLRESNIYLPLVSFCLAAGMAAYSLAWLVNSENARLMMAFMLFPLVVLTVMRADVWRDSRALLERVTEDAPEYFEGHQNLGEVYMALGHLPDATAEFLVAATLAPEDYRPYAGAAKSCAMQEKFQMAERFYQKAMPLAPSIAGLRYEYAQTLHNVKKFKEEKAQLLLVVELDPKFYQGWADLGVLQQMEGDQNAAITSFLAALKANPDYTPALHNLVKLLAESGDASGAGRYLKKLEGVDRRGARILRMNIENAQKP